MNLAGLEEALENVPGSKAALILNFPNNPTGYSPTVEEADKVVAILERLAKKGKKILAIMDDAYFGLFYEPGTCTESLFGKLADLHENILAAKVDGATKEELAWGFRVGFVTYGGKGLTEEQYESLVKKTMGAVRSSISNSNVTGQNLVLRGMKDPAYKAEKEAVLDILHKRYAKVREVLAQYPADAPLKVLPFNSGYFMTFECDCDPEKLRLRLLDTYGIGTISIPAKYLRIAFSSVEVEEIEDLYQTILKAAREVM